MDACADEKMYKFDVSSDACQTAAFIVPSTCRCVCRKMHYVVTVESFESGIKSCFNHW